jgi:3-keto-disaccharide hydrolase
MRKQTLVTSIVAVLLLICPALCQQKAELNDGEAHGDPPFLLEDGWRPLLNGKNLSGWQADQGKDNAWYTATGIRWERLLGPTLLRGVSGPGDRIVNGPTGRTANLVTDEKFGDVELYVEFLLAKGSNSGVYLHGLYEVQVFDSWASDMAPKTSDCGGIYHRWIDNQGVGGSAPKENVSRRPGEWQSFHIWFRGPRFDASGKKTENARFIRVLHNGLLVQKDVEVDGGTRAHMNIPEAKSNPIMIQGDHGPVAYRNIYVRPLRPIISR